MVKGDLNEETTNAENSTIIEREDLDQKLKKMDERLKQLENVLSK